MLYKVRERLTKYLKYHALKSLISGVVTLLKFSA
ncbi:hypothetical protein RD1_1256 [Roseobacter denitrificans OCh 114]|uniref:Uncharacterized protein n=1 Tax=Roseobacter denitrificans (strain ATCC 33942 / OCh 114) TaxID=375451 RepID=Q16AU0_ROSDO|nr:hypothetical protein RD1_1256 [Roseobacter denitrificans OCh 114]